MGGFNLTPEGLIKGCIIPILNTSLPTMFLGGGGYEKSLTAKYWTQITSVASEIKLAGDIPDHDEYFLSYGPSYDLYEFSQCKRQNRNTEEYINLVENHIKGFF